MKDNRQYSRKSIELPASFEILGGGEENLALATTLDISLRGLCINTRFRPRVGQELFIRVKLDHSPTVTLKARVIWIKDFNVLVMDEYRVGVCLVDPEGADERVFAEFCERSGVGLSPKGAEI